MSVLQGLPHHVSGVAQAAQPDFTTGTPLFMGLNVIYGQGHCVSTELETLLYVSIFTLSGGILPWRHRAFDDHDHTSVKSGVMTSNIEFSRRVLTYVPQECWSACASCFLHLHIPQVSLVPTSLLSFACN